MNFDKETRNLLAKTVASCRRRLIEDVTDQLRGIFGLHPDGTVLPLDKLTHLSPDQNSAARHLRDLLDHYTVGAAGKDSDRRKAAYERMILEISFTVLNRLAALRLCEARGLVVECVRKGTTSAGFQMFERISGGALGSRFETYRVFLECMFDELALGLGVLFDRMTPQSAVFPTERCMEDVLAELNKSELTHLWAEDETIGWVYQYFNPPEERKVMRDASQAPRNSRELAVRNQFFTPRYVVEFLTDNTLGRIWYEMTQGQTGLKDTCRYLVRRPDEVFLDDKHSPSDAAAKRWLMGEDEERPTAFEFADTVDTYKRHASVEAAADWLYANITRVTAGETKRMKTQDLLDLLFMLHRADHFSEGTLDHYCAEIERIIDELAERRNLRKSDDQTQEVLLNQPVFIPYRKVKDPREILMLDPACGSMHFGLYAFDIYETIYREALHPKFGVREKLLTTVGWAGAPELTILPESVKLKEDGTAFSDYLSQEVALDEAFVVVASEPDGGDGVEANRPYIVRADNKFRVPMSRRVPLIQFDYARAVQEGWFSARLGDTFVKESRCFVYQEPLTDDQAEEHLLNQIPRMIIEKNIHGIDIDPRAVQIAALALWLRAQKTWKTLGLKADARPSIAKSNIVTAEPMPGEEDMRREFTAGLKPRVLGQIVDEVFEKMKLAGEVGSLLKIEEEIKDAVAAAGKQWREGPKPEQQLLFPTMDAPRLKQQELRFDVKGITDVRFWEQAEDRILDALKEYAEQAENGHATRRRLFAEDAVRGFAFVDLCRKGYDVVLMNPPFGEAIPITRSYLVEAYPTGSKEMATCFVEMGADFTHRNGLVGAITSRFMLANNGLIEWRKDEFLNEAWNIQSFADLGYGVLDGAMVEACSYIVGLNHGNADRPFINCLDDSEKGDALLTAIASLMTKPDRRVALRSLQSFRSVPDHIICYWLPIHLLKAILRFDNLKVQGSAARVGLQTGDNERFARAVWEVGATNIGQGKDWFYFAKGGEYEPFYDDIHLVVLWKDDGYLLKRFVDKNGKLLSRPQNLEYFFREGITYPDRTTSDFSPRVMPRGIIFSSTGFALFPPNQGALLGYLGSAYTRPFKVLVEAFVGSGDSSVSGSAARHYRPGILNLLPNLLPAPEQALQQKIIRSIQIRIRTFEADETSRYFAAFPNLNSSTSIRSSAAVRWLDYIEDVVFLIETNVELEVAVRNVLGITIDDPVLDELYGLHPAALSASLPDAQVVMEAQELSEEALIERLVSADGAGRSTVKKSYFADRRIELVCRIFRISPKLFAAILNERKIAPKVFTHQYTQSLISIALGCAFGRWDIRYATGEKTAPELPDPFAPLPVCPPGQLQNAQGLPARSEDVHTVYPIRISWDGALVDDPGFSGDRPNRDDIVRRVREVFDLLWKDKAHEIEQEACDILGVSDLRDYFRKPTGFFQDHLKRYSKSRRKAPIYWPLSTPSGSYTLWLYYHRLNDQTIYAAVNKYVEPKISEVERGIGGIENDPKSASGRDATRLTNRLSEARTFLGELRDLREELLRIAALPFKPDLNDGVIINASPFHSLFRLRPWTKDTEDCWKKLQKGDYDWAHLAYITWPDRVREVCRTDRSIAIAHGLEDLCEVEAPGAKKKGGPGRRKREAAR